MNKKVDFKKTIKHLYNPPIAGFHLVDVPKMNYLMIDGKGNPNTSTDYQQAVEALYSMAYGVKFTLKPRGFDHVVPPLEGLWWMENMNDFNLANKEFWEWTMMIMQPEWVVSEFVESVREAAYKKKKNSSLMRVRFDAYEEGLAVQILYTGPYEAEAPTISAMHNFMKTNGYQLMGKHHEIYLGDPRKTLAEKLQTILRQPIRK